MAEYISEQLRSKAEECDRLQKELHRERYRSQPIYEKPLEF
jgi:hypothetical protein